jgi:hypothetical protein
MTDWIACAERMPEKAREYYLVWIPAGYFLRCYLTDDGKWLNPSGDERDITHWAAITPPAAGLVRCENADTCDRIKQGFYCTHNEAHERNNGCDTGIGQHGRCIPVPASRAYSAEEVARLVVEAKREGFLSGVQWRTDHRFAPHPAEERAAINQFPGAPEPEQPEARVLRHGYCDECGTKLIDNCPKCGAFICCPTCCASTPAQPKAQGDIWERMDEIEEA